mmetsp:Transcript_8395/g.11114  ORF Transcript_8395/g.11114 Transcript_8395/m.11114 type:complete len:323 (-) Transcript_8395:454-1422(-)
MGAFEYPLATIFVTIAVAVIAFHARDFCFLFVSRRFRTAHAFGALSFVLSLIFATLVLMFFQTVNISEVMCKASILTCATLYASTKLSTYLFLIERVHLVTAMKISHKNDKIFIRNISLLSPYGIILVLMLLSFIGYHGEAVTYGDSYDCYIGLEKMSAVPLVTYDSIFSVFLTLQFVKPLQNSVNKSERVQATARKNMIGSTVALVSSLLNILFLVLFPATRALYCLTFCVWDVLICTMVIYYMSMSNVLRNFAEGGSYTPTRDSQITSRVEQSPLSTGTHKFRSHKLVHVIHTPTSNHDDDPIPSPSNRIQSSCQSPTSK